MSYFETNQDECWVNFEEWLGDDGASYIQKRMQDLAKVYRCTFQDNYERSAFQSFISEIKEGDNARDVVNMEPEHQCLSTYLSRRLTDSALLPST
jgi:hypothetical protein